MTRPDCPRRRGQRGAVAVMAAVWVLVAIVILMSIDVGNLYFQRRDLQRIADMAAVAAVARINQTDTNCTNVKTNAQNSATANDKNAVGTGSPASGQDQINTTCGRWDPPTVQSSASPPPNYYVSPATVFPINAAQVTMTRNMTYTFMGLFGGLGAAPTKISASATARATNIDSFSVAGGLLSLGSTTCGTTGVADWSSNGLLNILLGSLLGSGSALNLTVGCYGALASANIRLGDLATSLNAGTPSGLVNTTVSVSSLLNASVQALNKNAAANVNLADATAALNLIIRSLSVNVGNQQVTVINPNQGQSPPTSAVIQLGVPQGQSPAQAANAAAQANVDLFDLVMAAVTLGNSTSQSAATVSLSTGQLAGFGFPTNLAGLQLQILTPPSPAIGEAGKVGGVYRTQATNSQIGLSLNIALPDINLLVATISGLKIPIYLLVGGPATANLETIDCENSTSQKPSWVTISATPNVASLCVGNAPTTASGWINLASNSGCPGTATSVGVTVTVPLIGSFPLISLPISSTGPILTLGAGGSQGSSSPAYYSNSASPPQFCVEKDVPSNCPAYWTTSSVPLSSQILNLNMLSIGPLTIAGIISVPIQTVTPLVAAILQPILNLIVPLLNSLLVPILNLLGAGIGQATVHQIGLTCGTPQLVY
ncbi:TadG family pilus assembly protein [Burkholderia sp. MR1-5-21]